MPFISSSQVYSILKCDRFFALNDVIHICTLRHINDEVAYCVMLVKTDTTAEGVEKVKISVDPDKLITKIFLAI